MKPCVLMLTCKDKNESEKITSTLLKKRLIACAKRVSCDSSFLWKNEMNTSEEVLLFMDSDESYFDIIEKEISKIHSYETFVLVALPVTKISHKASNWLQDELKS